MLTRWYGASCVPHVNVAVPAANSRTADVSRSTCVVGSRSMCAQHARRLGVENKPRQRNRVAADIHQRAAAHVGLIADVVRVVVVVGKVRVDRAELADAAVAHQLPGRLPLRMKAVHERFHHLQLRVRRRNVGELLGLGHREPDRLLAQHVLAGLDRPQRPRHVQVIGQRNVNRIDVAVGEQLVVRAVRLLRCPVAAATALRMRQIARGDRRRRRRFRSPASRE